MFTEPYSAKILVYHGISPGEEETSYYRNIDKFRADMEYIKSLDVDVITYDALIENIKNGFYLERPAVVISFDDGISSDYQYAYPILKEYDFPAIFFLIGTRSGNWANYQEMMNYRNSDNEQLFFVGSHSYEHTRHILLDENHLMYQFSKSREIMYDFFGEYLDHLALPFGSGISSSKVSNAAIAAGFTSVRGISPGLIDLYSDPTKLEAKMIYSYSKIENIVY